MFMIAIFLIRKDLNKKKVSRLMLQPRIVKMKIGERNCEYGYEKRQGVIRSEIRGKECENEYETKRGMIRSNTEDREPKYEYKRSFVRESRDMSARNGNGGINDVHVILGDKGQNGENDRVRMFIKGKETQCPSSRMRIVMNGTKTRNNENGREFTISGNREGSIEQNRRATIMRRNERNEAFNNDALKHANSEKTPMNGYSKPYQGKLEFVVPSRKGFTFTNVKFNEMESKIHNGIPSDKFVGKDLCITRDNCHSPNETLVRINNAHCSRDRAYRNASEGCIKRSGIIQEAAQALLILKYRNKK
ncbi:signal peptidase I [Trachipleistophora hominis]|uniref:Signal peptidase I n=1 Tax=Trachipleistophora hominis TaxID=72359 RepID=L7JUW2_TRAHO|nr:signal peptidase I [Trachipleistophora hominis]